MARELVEVSTRTRTRQQSWRTTSAKIRARKDTGEDEGKEETGKNEEEEEEEEAAAPNSYWRMVAAYDEWNQVKHM